MPALNLVRQYRIYKLMLLNNRQALEFRRLYLQRIHGPATAADVLDL